MTDIQSKYDASPRVVRQQVDTLLGMTTPPQSPDPGKPWTNIGPVNFERAVAFAEKLERINEKVVDQ